MKKVVGFAGRAGSGKSTAAAMLHSMANPEKGHNIEFSDPIVSMAQARATRLLDEGADLVTICGVRSEYDAQAVRSIGGSIVRLTRGTPGQLLPTEAGINAWQEDFHIVNNGTLDDLQERIRTLNLTELPEAEAM
jgi:energy-coupling factor transporter ATP-binding protein EcfA2